MDTAAPKRGLESTYAALAMLNLPNPVHVDLRSFITLLDRSSCRGNVRCDPGRFDAFDEAPTRGRRGGVEELALVRYVRGGEFGRRDRTI